MLSALFEVKNSLLRLKMRGGPRRPSEKVGPFVQDHQKPLVQDFVSQKERVL